MTVIKEKAETLISAPPTTQQIPEGNYSRRRVRKYSDWLADSRQYRRAAINKQTWIGSEDPE